MPTNSVEPASWGQVPRRPRLPWKPLDTVAAAHLSYRSFLTDYVAANRPVVVHGAVTHWAALSKWTPEFFKASFADKPVAVSYEASMPFDQFIDAVMASDDQHPGPYMYRLFLHEHLPEVLKDLIPQNPYSYPRRFSSPLMRPRWRRPDGYLKLLIGGVGSKFPVMHFDTENANAAITEIYGDKEFVMYAPDDAPYFYVNPKVPNKSLVDDLDRPDLQRFPLLAKATRFRAVLKPGDMVFVPARWWHTARALSPSISVCVNMLDSSNWGGFVDEVCGAIGERSRVKAGLARAYLTGLGALMSAMEGVQERAPALASVLRFPALIAPATSQWTKEPSAQQIKVLVPTP